jgi:hypothetical protein
VETVELIVVAYHGDQGGGSDQFCDDDAAWQSSSASVRGAGNVRIDGGWLYRWLVCTEVATRPRQSSAQVRQSSGAEDLVRELCEDFRAADALESANNSGVASGACGSGWTPGRNGWGTRWF